MKQIAVFLAAGLVSGGLWAISVAPAHADDLPDPTIRAVGSTAAPQSRATTPRQPRTSTPAPSGESRAEFLARITAKYGSPTIRQPAAVAPARSIAAPSRRVTPSPRRGTVSARMGNAHAAISAPATHPTGRRQLTIPTAPRATAGPRARLFRTARVATQPPVDHRVRPTRLAAPIVRARATPTPRPTYARAIRPARAPARVATPITRAPRPARRAAIRPITARRATPKPLTVPRSPMAPRTDTTAPRSLLKPASPGCESG